jgi:hypothetical protein
MGSSRGSGDRFGLRPAPFLATFPTFAAKSRFGTNVPRHFSPVPLDASVAPNTPRHLRATSRGVDDYVGVANLTATGCRRGRAIPKRQGV